ncbi:hypothetical protein BDK88_4381 [Natrinema hispanicum]|uniref:Uncharacterized protein n=1 Tax=Natrinema hispanicum TaxID=392421 RepID=A0A482Y6R0_9EURY|nr:hypothetical protein BDK88_4381 [Natrinema hispanicum]
MMVLVFNVNYITMATKIFAEGLNKNKQDNELKERIWFHGVQS